MATNYVQTNTSATFNVGCSGQTAGVTTGGREAQVGGSAGTTEFSFDPDSTLTRACVVFLLDKPGISSWSSGTWTIPINHTAMDGDTSLTRIDVCDFLSGTGYTTVASKTSGLNHTAGGTGVTTETVTQGSGHTPQSSTDSQPFIVLTYSSAAGNHGGSSGGITPDQTISAPYTLSTAHTASPSDGVKLGEDFTIQITESFDAEGVTLGDTATAPTANTASVSDGAKFGEDFDTVWTATFNAEGVSLSDSATIPTANTASISDGANLGDTAQADVGDALADGAAMGDTAAAVTDSPARAASDGVKLGEDFDTVWTATFNAEGVSLSDSATAPAANSVSVSDGVKFAEDFTTTVTVAGQGPGVSFGDTAAATVESPSRSVSDGITLAEDFTLVVTESFDAEGIALGDTATAPTANTASISDGVTFAEDFTTVHVEVGAPEVLRLGDSVDYLERTGADGVTLGDTLTASASKAESATEGISLSDVVSSASVLSDSLTDGAVAGDTATVDVGASLSDGIVGSDVADYPERIGVDGVTLGDTLTGTSSKTESASEGISLSDTATSVFSFNDSNTDGVAVGDTAASDVGTLLSDGIVGGDQADYPERTAADGVTLADTPAASASTSGSGTDGISLSEAIALMLAFRVTISDGAAFGDSSAPSQAIFPALSDGVSAGDTTIFSYRSTRTTPGWVELLDRQAHSVTLSDRQAHFVDLYDKHAHTVTIGEPGTFVQPGGFSDGFDDGFR